VVRQPTKEGAIYTLNLLSATGTGILLSAIVGGLVMKYNPVQLASQFLRTIWLVRYSLLTIVLMLALGTLTRYSGTDTTLGLAFANTGVFYPFFGTPPRPRAGSTTRATSCATCSSTPSPWPA
jgi:lactate permease